MKFSGALFEIRPADEREHRVSEAVVYAYCDVAGAVELIVQQTQCEGRLGLIIDIVL